MLARLTGLEISPASKPLDVASISWIISGVMATASRGNNVDPGSLFPTPNHLRIETHFESCCAQSAVIQHGPRRRACR